MQELTGKGSAQQAFEENIKDRLRKDIGDLIPPEVLSALISKAMEDLFFKHETKPEHGGWNARQIPQPSWFELEVSAAVGPLIRAHLEQWLKANREAIEAVCVAEIVMNGPKMLASLFVQILVGNAKQEAYSMVADLTNRMREKGVQV